MTGTFGRSAGAAALAGILCAGVCAQESPEPGGLARKGWLGAMIAPPASAGIEGDGVLVQRVLPGGSAEGAGLEAGDIVIASGTELLAKPSDLLGRLAKMSAGDSMPLKLKRDGAEREVTLKLGAKPMERSDKFEVSYGSVQVGDFRVRTVWTKPKGDGPFPTVYMIQGVHCGSIETAMAPVHESRDLANGLAELGYAVVRIEKPGVGDSSGPPCGTIDWDLEVESFRRGLADTMTKPWVDKGRVFLFGHSMGGVTAPVLASEVDVAGIAVYGTSGLPWQEYLIENTRRQVSMEGTDHAELERVIKQSMRFHSLFFELDLPLSEMRAKYPDLAEFTTNSFTQGDQIFGRQEKFWQQMEDLEILSYWQKAETPVLAVWGGSEFVTSKRDHEAIVDAVNSWRPGTAKLAVLEGADHGLRRAATAMDSMAAMADPSAPSEFASEIVAMLDGWMKETAPSGRKGGKSVAGVEGRNPDGATNPES